MKKSVVLLGALSAALVVALVLRSQRSTNQIQSAQSEVAGISNQLSEAQLKLNHQERLNSSFKGQLEERDARLAQLSNTVAQIRADLARSRAESDAARQATQDSTEKANALAAERDALSNQVSELKLASQGQERSLREASGRVLAVESDLAAMSSKLASEQMQKQRLETMLKNPAALENQLETIRDWDYAAKSSRSNSSPNYRLPLQLQADGSVVLATPPPQKTSAN